MQLQRAEAHLAKVVAAQQRIAHAPPIGEIEEVASAELHHLCARGFGGFILLKLNAKLKENMNEMERELIPVASAELTHRSEVYSSAMTEWARGDFDNVYA